MHKDVRQAGTATSRSLAIAFAIMLAGLFAGKAQSAAPPPDPGKAIETKGAAKADAAGALLAKADECRERLLKTCVNEQYKFTPRVREAFLACAKAQAKSDLQSQGKSLPDEFFAWIDADPEMEAGVYGAHHKASDVLLRLYS
ncbi:MAG TPA: hypothetical protein VM238_19495, partial [Phycisphaerae bacterium]|nr:hypothetical protein [Phycisphaerae bacterium]